MRRRILYVLTCGWSGAVKPTMNLIEERYETAGVVNEWLPKSAVYWNMLRSFYPDRMVWWRRMNFLNEHSPEAFLKRTEICEKAMKEIRGGYDLILQNGVLHAPGAGLDNKKYIIMTDSTRKLSTRNAYDDQVKFTGKAEAMRWYELEGEVYRKAAGLIVGCERVRDSLIDDYGVDPARIHNCGYVAGVGFETSGAEKSFDGKTVLYVGKGDFEKKGGKVLLEAFVKVRAAVKDAELFIVGQDSLKGGPGVAIVGFVSDRERLKDLFRKAHLFVLPSLVDRNPLTLVEAMATSTPVIATDYGAMPEIVGDAGFIVKAGDADGLARRIIEILEHKDLARKLGEKGRERHRGHFSPEVVKERYFKAIDAVLGEVKV